MLWAVKVWRDGGLEDNIVLSGLDFGFGRRRKKSATVLVGRILPTI